MSKQYQEIDLPRFSREITLSQNRVDEPSNETTDRAVGLLQPFTGVLDLQPTVGQYTYLDLTFAVLQPFVLERFLKQIYRTTQTARSDTESQRIPKEIRKEIHDGPTVLVHQVDHIASESASVPTESNVRYSEAQGTADQPLVVERFPKRTRWITPTDSLNSRSKRASGKNEMDVRGGPRMSGHRVVREDSRQTLAPTEPNVSPLEIQKAAEQLSVEKWLAEWTRLITQTGNPAQGAEQASGKGRTDAHGGPELLVHRVDHLTSESTPVSTGPSVFSSKAQRTADRPLVIERFSERIHRITQPARSDTGSQRIPRETRSNVGGGAKMLVHQADHLASESARVPVEPSATPVVVQRPSGQLPDEGQSSKRTRRITQTDSPDNESVQVSGKSRTGVRGGPRMSVHRVVSEDFQQALAPTEPNVSPIGDRTSKRMRRLTQTASPDNEPEQTRGPDTHREPTVPQALRSERETEQSRESRIYVTSQDRDRSNPSNTNDTPSHRPRSSRETVGFGTHLTTRTWIPRTGRNQSEASASPPSHRTVTDLRVTNQLSSPPFESRQATQETRSFRTAAEKGSRETPTTPDTSIPISENGRVTRRTETENRDVVATKTEDRQLRRYSQRTERIDRNDSSDPELRSSKRERDDSNRERAVPFSSVSRDLLQRKDEGDVERPQSKETTPPDSTTGSSNRPSSQSPIHTESNASQTYRTEMTVLDRERGMNETAVYRENESNIRRTTVETTSITPPEDIIIGTYSTPTMRSLGQNSDDIPEKTVKRDRLGTPSRKDAPVGGSPSEEPYPTSGSRSSIAPEMTLKRDRSPASIEVGTRLEKLPKKSYNKLDNINAREETTYPFTSSSECLMNNDTDIDRLVDRLYTKFERKIRIERERQGL